MKCPKYDKGLVEISCTVGPTERLEPKTGKGVPIPDSKSSTGHVYYCPNPNCESKKEYVRTSRTGMDPDVPHNVEELIKKIDELKHFLAYEHVYKTIFSKNGAIIQKYQPKTEYERQFDYRDLDSRHFTFQVRHWMAGTYILFVVTYVEDLLGEYRKNQNIDVSYYDMDEYIILKMIRNAVAHGFIWKIDSRFSRHLPKTYKGFEYTENLHGQKLDLKQVNCNLVYDLLTDLSNTLKKKIN